MTENSRSLDEEVAYLLKGAADVISEEELRGKLSRSHRNRKPLTVKVGFDPTAPDIHLGHTVLLRKMKHFQDLGHRVIFLIGDFTGMIGDPSGRNKTRPSLSEVEIQENARTYREQIFKILDPVKTVIEFNSHWLGKLGSREWIELCGKYTVARMLERDDFSRRMAAHQPISIHELLYPLAQAYDSVVLGADFELGGTDQRFNLLVGREIQRESGLEPQVLLMTPLLEGLDGVEKMSKSLGNHVGIDEPPQEIFGKVMSISDDLMWNYYLLLTDLSAGRLQELREGVDSGKIHPMQAKLDLAHRLVSDLHSEAAAREARQHFERVFQGGETPEEMPTFALACSGRPIGLTEIMAQVKFAPSKTEARRLIQQGAVSIDGERIQEPAHQVDPGAHPAFVLRVGRRKFGRIHLE